jgi:uncharacterized protein with HEPN domain
MLRDLETLIDIFTSIALIFDYMEGVEFETFLNNLEKQDAVLRRITIIGEATKRLSSDFREQHPSIPWKQIAGIRDVITHDYDEVDCEEIWSVICNDLPLLFNYIKPLIRED